MPKRKAKDLGDEASLDEPRRSSRRVSTPKEQSEQQTSKPIATPQISKKAGKVKKVTTAGRARKEHDADADVNGKVEDSEELKSTKPAKSTKKASSAKIDQASTGRQYWLMKAEPESRFEKGKDIKFSIDDLAAKTEPEPWDGIRAYPVSAHDSSAPYYDASSKPDNPKWSVVHVVFKQKLKTPITLKELKAWQQAKGNPLEEMQMMKLARISVSKVREEEWRFLVEEMKERGDIIAE
ncbi:Thymocyte nuclear protein [Lachnellula willkommii]|uniref:Thymocyte nuclear protein n=1 Tax=Lachnellula willkommii TaxID=215461 RepID=A0A559MJ56_9HELO|nr:Thymocyte nuclear protein [Lachnellula willkommii]